MKRTGKKRELTPEEIAYIQENYQTMRVRQMATHLNIAWETLNKRMLEMGLQPNIKEAQWPDEDVAKLRELAQTHTTKEIAALMGRSANSIRIKARRMGIVLEKTPRLWLPEDEDYLKRNWGKLSVSTLAKNLKREANAVCQRAHVLNLPPIFQASEDLSISDFTAYTGISRDRVVRYLAIKHDFPLKKKKVGAKAVYYYVLWDEVLPWLETHQDLYDGSLISEDLFIPEPAWLTKKRHRDREDKSKIHYQVTKRPWTPADIDRAKFLLSIGKHHADIAEELHRSEKAVAYKLSQLGLAYRLSKYYRGSEFRYIREHWETMTDAEMAKHLRRSKKSVAEQRRKMGLYKKKPSS